MPTQSERNKAYYEANKEKEKQRSLSYYHQNKAKIDREQKKVYMAEYLKTYKRKPITPEKRQEVNQRRRERYATDPQYQQKLKDHAKAKHRLNPEAKRSGRLKAEYNLTIEEYQAMLEMQGNGCAICGVRETGVSEKGKRQRSLSVDHDHKTGKVRGILCHRCNFAIGQLQDNPELLLKAAEYLTR